MKKMRRKWKMSKRETKPSSNNRFKKDNEFPWRQKDG
jgi:hypothetical protein